jgi:hypothetical protein
MVFGGGSSAELVEMARRMVASYAIVPYYGRLFGRQGFGEEVDVIQAAWQSGDRSGAARQVSAAMLAEVVSLGGGDAHREKIEAYRRSGLGTAVVWLHSPDPTPQTVRRLMAEIASPD